MKKHFKLTAICLLILSTAMAQDTLKIGVNEELINITPPALNQKVYVVIEDSNYNYQIRISKLPKNIDPDNISLLSFIDTLADMKKWNYSSIKKKKIVSTLFSEMELGVNYIPFHNHYDVNYGVKSDLDYIAQHFVSNGENSGFYASLNFRTKKRYYNKPKNYYFYDATQARFNKNYYQGYMHYTEHFGREQEYDSIGRTDTIRADVSISQLFLVKRFAFGIILNKAKTFSIEYGLDLGIRISNQERPNVYFGENDSYKRIYSNNVVALPFVSIDGLATSNIQLLMNHRLGINYKKVTLNVGMSMRNVKMGSKSYEGGHMMSAGLAYRFR